MAKTKDSPKKKPTKSSAVKTKVTKKSRITTVTAPKSADVRVKVYQDGDKRKKQTAKNMQVVSGFERYKMIEVAAYYLAEKNQFSGNAADYWVEAEKIIDAKVSIESETPKAAPKRSKSTKKNDGLTIVEGIGPKIEALLIADGIADLSDLANARVDTLSEILKKAGPRFTMHKADTWPQQAALARDGNFAELYALQEKLDGGR